MLTCIKFLRNSQPAAKTIQSLKTYSTNEVEQIVIPKRIPRNPTDILRALESTISRDPTAPNYKYHDDPYLIPTSNLAKRTYALSQESGRKAAHWVRQENRNLFLHREADPMIPSFVPKMVYDENTAVLEEDLQKVIKSALVTDAVLVYNILNNKGISISLETRQSLLELLCYYNHIEPLPEEFIEERWFRQSHLGKERQRKTWKDGALAEELFIGIDNPGREAYCALIQGMVKYGQIERAWQLYQECQQKNLIVSTDTYNSIISAAGFIREGNDLRWSFICDTLSAMRQAQVKPNLGTLNAVLKTLSIMGTGKIIKTYVLQTIAEFKKLEIEPSLTSFYYVLITFCKERGPRNPVLNDIINYLDGKELKVQDLKDLYFFATAMDVCRYHLHDNALAKRVDTLLHLGNNYDLIGNSYKESIYYRHYLNLMCDTEPFEIFMENVYHKIVPHIYIPEPSVMVDVLKSLEIHAAVDYLPGLWSDVVIFDQTDREDIVNLFLNIMVDTDAARLPQKFADISWNIWNRLTEENETNARKITPTAEMLGKMMILLLRNKDLRKASVVMDALDTNQSIVGVPSFEALSLFVQNSIENKLPNKAISCIQFAAERGFDEALSLAIELNKTMTLDETHMARLIGIFGSDVFEKQILKA